MAGITLAAAGIGILGSVVGGMIGSRKAKDAAAAAKAEKRSHKQRDG